MGEGIGYICKKCKEQKIIHYGIGFLGFKEFYTEHKFQNLLEIVKDNNLKNYSNLITFVKIKNADIKDGYGYDAYICPKCKRLDNKFRFSLFADNKSFIPKYSCKYCNGTLRVLKKNEKFEIKCDNCGSEEFEEETDFWNWD